MGRRVYTDQDKALVLVTLEGNKGNVKQTARETGVPAATVRLWRDKAERGELDISTVEALPAIRTELVEDIDRVRDKYLRILEEKADRRDVSARDAITAFGVLTDKSRLIQGKPTSRTEADGGAGNLPIDQVRELFAGFAQGIYKAASERDAAISSVVEEEPIDAEWSEQAPLALIHSA